MYKLTKNNLRQTYTYKPTKNNLRQKYTSQLKITSDNHVKAN